VVLYQTISLGYCNVIVSNRRDHTAILSTRHAMNGVSLRD